MKRIKQDELLEIVKQYLIFDLSFEVEENRENSFIFKRNLGKYADYLYIEYCEEYITFKIEISSEIQYKSYKIAFATYGLDILNKLNEILQFAQFFAFNYAIK